MNRPLTVVTFLWGDDRHYNPVYVDRLGLGLRRFMNVPYRFICITDRSRSFGNTVDYQAGLPDPELTQIKGCFCRLRLFDPVWQGQLGLLAGDRVMCLDLDIIITGKLGHLTTRPEPFIILQGVNSPSHPCKYNGSVWLTTAGYRPDVWSDFSLEKAEKAPKLTFADDQGWFQYKMGDAGAYTDRDGVYAFAKGPWPTGQGLPDNACIVAFPGKRDPAHYVTMAFVRKFWLGVA